MLLHTLKGIDVFVGEAPDGDVAALTSKTHTTINASPRVVFEVIRNPAYLMKMDSVLGRLCSNDYVSIESALHQIPSRNVFCGADAEDDHNHGKLGLSNTCGTPGVQINMASQ